MHWFNKIKNKCSLLLAVIGAQILFIDNVYAQFAAPSSSDLSVSFLSQIFGGLTGGGADAFGASIATFNGAILTIGGILAAYTILAGTLGTAHDGEMLGKKFSSVWVPIRYALGTALVLPVLGGGYCVMQAIVMWIVMQGISLGNMAWGAYVTAPPLTSSISTKSSKEVLDLVVQTYIANVCVEANKKAVSDADSSTGSMLKLKETASYGVGNDSDGNFLFGNQKYPYTASNCGVLSIPKKTEAPVSSSAPTGGGSSSLSGLSSLYKNIDPAAIRTSHVDATKNLVTSTQQLALLSIDDPEKVTFPQLEAIAKTYITSVQTSANNLLASSNSSSGVAAAATSQGWFLAGSWFTKIINAQNTVNTALGDISSAQGRISSPISSISVRANELMANGHKVLVDYNQDSKALTDSPDGKKGGESAKSTDTGVRGKIASFFSDMMTGLDLKELKDDNRHPIILMNAVGNNMISFFGYAMLAGGAAVGVASFFSLGAAGATATIVSSFLIAPLAILFTTGISLAYILPNLPLLIWMGIIIGWSIMVVEAIIAAPLWAIMHLHPNGDDLTGRGGNGYMLVLGLLLRPVLIIFGFIASIVLSGLFGQFVNKIFFETFASSQLGGTMGFFSVIAGTAVYAIIMYTVLTKTLNLMHIIPDQLMRWIGGGGEQLGQYAGGFSGEGMAKTAAAVGAVSGYVGSGAINNASSGLNQLNQAAQARKGANAQLAANKADIVRGDQQASSALGTDAGSAFASIDRANGGDQQRAAADKSQFSQTSSALGGPNSIDAASYRNIVATQMEDNPDMSFSEAHNNALSGTLDEKFGSGAFGAATQLSGGATSGPKFNAAMGALAKTQTNLTNSGVSPSDTKNVMSGIINKAMSETNKNPESSFAANLQDASNEVKGGRSVPEKSSAFENNPLPEVNLGNNLGNGNLGNSNEGTGSKDK